MQLDGLNKLATFSSDAGYVSSIQKETPATNYMAKGSENGMLSAAGKVRNFRGITKREDVLGGPVMTNVAETYASLGEDGDLDAYGSIMNVYAALFYIGLGAVRLVGVDLLVNAASTLSLLIKRNGSYTDPDSGPYQAGLAPPSAPVIEAVEPPGGMTGKVTGTVSVVVWRIRSTSGAESNASPVSNIVTAVNQSIAVQFPGPDANGQNAWGVGVTKQIEGRVGSHFKLLEVLESDVAADPDRIYTIEWRDGDLAGRSFAPFRYGSPPAGLFAGTLEDVLFIDGAYADAELDTSGTDRGTAIAPSEPGKPESFAPDTVIFTDDTPTALLKGPGMYFRFGRNSMMSITHLGGPKPLSVEPVWNLGVEHQHNVCLGRGGQVYMWNGARGLLRMGQDGLPEGDWAAAITDDLVDCTDSRMRVLGYDGINQVIAIIYEKRIWPYFTSLDRFGSPADLSDTDVGNIVAAVTENNRLLLVDDEDAIWDYDTGTGSLLRIRTPWVSSPRSMDTISLVTGSVRVDNDSDDAIGIAVYADGIEDEPVAETVYTPERTGYFRLPAWRPNIIDCEQHALEITIQSETADGDSGMEHFESFGPSHEILR